MKIFFFTLFIALIFSCSSDLGNKVVGGNLTVYYTDVNDQKLAESVAMYFKENELISTQKQDLQLVRLKNKIQLRLIATDEENIKNMPFEERKLLTDLQSDLYQQVFNSPFELVLCNNKFEPLINMNK